MQILYLQSGVGPTGSPQTLPTTRQYGTESFQGVPNFQSVPARIEKKTIRRIAVRETILSRHHGAPIEVPPETPRSITALSY